MPLPFMPGSVPVVPAPASLELYHMRHLLLLGQNANLVMPAPASLGWRLHAEQVPDPLERELATYDYISDAPEQVLDPAHEGKDPRQYAVQVLEHVVHGTTAHLHLF